MKHPGIVLTQERVELEDHQSTLHPVCVRQVLGGVQPTPSIYRVKAHNEQGIMTQRRKFYSRVLSVLPISSSLDRLAWKHLTGLLTPAREAGAQLGRWRHATGVSPSQEGTGLFARNDRVFCGSINDKESLIQRCHKASPRVIGCLSGYGHSGPASSRHNTRSMICHCLRMSLG